MLKQSNGKIKYFLKGLLIAFILTIIMIVIFSFLLRFTSIRENKIPLFNNIVMIISIVVASAYVATKAKEKGWLNGALIGLGYYIILLVLNLIFIKPFAFDLVSFSKIVMAVITGIIGGMIGINLS